MIKPKSPALQADSLPSEPPEKFMLHQGSQTDQSVPFKGALRLISRRETLELSAVSAMGKEGLMVT